MFFSLFLHLHDLDASDSDSQIAMVGWPRQIARYCYLHDYDVAFDFIMWSVVDYTIFYAHDSYKFIAVCVCAYVLIPFTSESVTQFYLRVATTPRAANTRPHGSFLTFPLVLIALFAMSDDYQPQLSAATSCTHHSCQNPISLSG